MKAKQIYLTGVVIAIGLLLAGTGCTSTPVVVAPEPMESSGTPTDAGKTVPAAAEAVYRKISAEEAKERMDAGDVIVLDVRTPEEFEEGHIQGAILLPDYEIVGKAETVLPDKDTVILVYCRSGNRSEMAAKKLVELGYTGIHDFGGIINWPYEVVKE